MGTPPGCAVATIYYGIYELDLLRKYEDNLVFLVRYIDDIFGVWLDNDERKWTEFRSDLDVDDLRWECEELALETNFLDMRITITGSRIKTDLFEKSLNLYLFIPPSSCHSAGVLNGIILDGVHRIYPLCSDERAMRRYLLHFRDRLIARGYRQQMILPFFRMAIHKQTVLRIENNIFLDDFDTEKKLFLHLSHHPQNPPNRLIQQLYERILKPLGAPDLCVCLHRTRNLRNALLYRRMELRPGPATSSYITLTVDGCGSDTVGNNRSPSTHTHTHPHTHTHTHTHTFFLKM